MEWVGGTKKVITLINELEKDGSLLNVYSNEVSNNPNIKELYDKSLEELQQKYGKKFLNHLLIGCFHSSNLNLLINSFKACGKYFNECYLHGYYDTRPCFGIINLRTKSICLINVGNRKGHLYEDYFNLSMKNLDKTKDEFEKLDYIGIVGDIRNSMTVITNIMNKMSYYEDNVNNKDIEKLNFQEKYLQRMFPKFSLDWIQDTFEPF